MINSSIPKKLKYYVNYTDRTYNTGNFGCQN